MLMEKELSFGEYMRRLRRGRKLSLHMLAEKTGLNYPHLSRLENDSALPRADTVAKIADALDGDVKTMWQLADCLPRTILDRIISTQEERTFSSLNRASGFPAETGEDSQGQLPEFVAQLMARHGLSEAEGQSLIDAMAKLATMDTTGRNAIIALIQGLVAGGDHGQI